jgi:hypothetical protein
MAEKNSKSNQEQVKAEIINRLRKDKDKIKTESQNLSLKYQDSKRHK